MIRAAHERLLVEVRALIASTPVLAEFAGDRLDGPLPLELPDPRDTDCLHLLGGFASQAGPETQALTDAVLSEAPHLHWRQTYGKDQVGADFLSRSGWFNLVSPDGPFVSPEMRISIGLWDQGFTYPWHWHVPSEIYVVLAGRAIFRTGGMEDADLGPGGLREHPSLVVHAAEMRDAPLFAHALWRGEGLNAPSTLCAAPADATPA
ncbi:MAG: dimethylsulfonioproprionate lyase family protein [Pseudomonadota bacterium]